jgi:large subunit ribosomal protein L17
MLRNLVTSFLEKERVQTTTAKAKEVRPIAEKMITLGKKGTLSARRQAGAFIRKESVVTKVFDELGPRFGQRPGGYSRIVKLGARKGDGAEMLRRRNSSIIVWRWDEHFRPGCKSPSFMSIVG